MTKFLKGRFLSIWNKQCQVWENARETLVAVDDIKRVKACTVLIHSPKTRTNIGTRNSLVITAVGRVKDSERSEDYYELTDPIDVIAEAIGRDEGELAAMVLELEVRE